MDTNELLRTYLIGPPARLLFPVHFENLERLPLHGPYILAFGPHSTEIESLAIAAALWQYSLRFYIKESYVEHRTPFAAIMRASDQIPINRLDSEAAQLAIRRGGVALMQGKILCVYPEGTRYADGRLHPLYSGAVQTAWYAERELKRNAAHRALVIHSDDEPTEHLPDYAAFTGPDDQFLSRVPIFPAGLSGFGHVQPDGTIDRSPLRKRTVTIGEALRTGDFLPANADRLSARAIEFQVRRAMMEELKVQLLALSGAGYSSERKEITEA